MNSAFSLPSASSHATGHTAISPARPSTFSRRLLLGGAAGAALTASVPLSAHAAPPSTEGYPFTLGVASGDPGPGRITLWTRLATDPYAEDGAGGMPDRVVPVQWQLATDENFRTVVRDGRVLARPEDAHSVHLDLEGLGDREYWYRFRFGRSISPVGRTLTTPAAGVTRPLHMIHVSCSHYEGGLFTAYGHAADEHPDLVLGLGDYIYEGAGNSKAFRTHPGSTCVGLADYRRRYSWYKAEPELQRLHAVAPWMLTWDDHEIQDNWAGLYPKNGVPTEAWQ